MIACNFQNVHKVSCLHNFSKTKYFGFSGGSEGKESACNVGDPGSIPGSGRPPAEVYGNPLPYSCLKMPMLRGAWQAIVVLGVAKSGTQLSD